LFHISLSFISFKACIKKHSANLHQYSERTKKYMKNFLFLFNLTNFSFLSAELIFFDHES